jgi:hypothetical protein
VHIVLAAILARVVDTITRLFDKESKAE